MSLQKNSQIFLDKFTEEILRILKERYKNRTLELIEEERTKNAIAAEKLRQKFTNYQEDIKNIPQLHTTITVIQEPKKEEREEMVRSIIHTQSPIIPPVQVKEISPEKKEIPQIVKKPQTENQIQKSPIQQQSNIEKILTMLKDHLITYIECPGENKNIITRRAGSTNRTQIILKKPEILEIIKYFSDKARIPLVEGMLNARVEDLEITALASENLNPSFIIKRILIQVNPEKPSQLEKPMMQFNQNQQNKNFPIPPINRPFTPNSPNSEEKAEQSIWNKKIKIGS